MHASNPGPAKHTSAELWSKTSRLIPLGTRSFGSLSIMSAPCSAQVIPSCQDMYILYSGTMEVKVSPGICQMPVAWAAF